MDFYLLRSTRWLTLAIICYFAQIWNGLEFWTPQHEHLHREYRTLPLPSGYKEDVHVRYVGYVM